MTLNQRCIFPFFLSIFNKRHWKNMVDADIVISSCHPPFQYICELLNSDLYHFKMYFQNFGKIWGLIENPLSESFNSQSKYFNFWARNVNWKYRFGFYHHQTSLHHSKSNFHFSKKAQESILKYYTQCLMCSKVGKAFLFSFWRKKRSIESPTAFISRHIWTKATLQPMS